jgi:hypothetical protein
VSVSKSEQVPEDGQVRPKYVAVDSDFNVVLNWEEIVNRGALTTAVRVWSYISRQQDAEIQYSE